MNRITRRTKGSGRRCELYPDLSVTKIAARAGVSVQTLSKVLRGRLKGSPDLIIRLSRIMRISQQKILANQAACRVMLGERIPSNVGIDEQR